ncbi:hypothetical protein [Actinoplanes sp. TFC3]|uniref:hypothetical protein n=1 Tax=Actinoplanes sp. TFC3 TaxID=1710355 RepID=UPI00082D795F|nr:hypothetical protein [Actinoplanes sp. TFC3]
MTLLPVILLALAGAGVLLSLLAVWLWRRPAGMPTALPRWAGVGIGLVIAVITARSGGLGSGLLLAAPLFAWCALTGVLVGELLMRRPDGPTRTATLEVRRIRNYLPRALSTAVAASGGLLLLVLCATTAAGQPDDRGRAGRSLGRQCTPDLVEAHGPWPGSYYTVAVAVVVLIGLGMAYAALHTVVRRPRFGEVSADDALRRRSAGAVVGAVGLLIAIPLAGVSLTAAGRLFAFSCAPQWWTVVAWALLAVVLAALVMVVWCATTVFTTKDRVGQLQ